MCRGTRASISSTEFEPVEPDLHPVELLLDLAEPVFDPVKAAVDGGGVVGECQQKPGHLTESLQDGFFQGHLDRFVPHTLAQGLDCGFFLSELRAASTALLSVSICNVCLGSNEVKNYFCQQTNKTKVARKLAGVSAKKPG